MPAPLSPVLYELNTRIHLNELSSVLGRHATLDDIPDAELDHLRDLGFDWIWFLGLWQTGSAGRQVALENPQWQQEFRQALPGLQPADICGSCFAVCGYVIDSRLGGNAALARLRERLHRRGLKLLLDFVPNHTALDHPWVTEHPDFYIHGTEAQLQREPQNYIRIGSVIFAYGRDPYFPGWPDTLQLNYANPVLHQAMQRELVNVAGLCDGLRCDMAMLVLPDIFESTWGVRPQPFWPRTIESVRALYPDFLFLAEVYWDLEWVLQQAGFDFTYDKRLYDRLRAGQARSVREHLWADAAFQKKLARFIENHDEARAAAAFPPDMHRAAAVITYLTPGMRFFHDGQLEGRTIKVPVHLCRRRDEPVNTELHDFYRRLLNCSCAPVTRNGEWRLLECVPAWQGNWTSDSFLAFCWQDSRGGFVLCAANYAPHHSQCYVRLPFEQFHGRTMRLQDQLGPALYDRNGDDLLSRGLYLDLVPWGHHVFRVTPL